MRKRKVIGKEELLRARPYRNDSLTSERGDNGETLVVFKRKRTLLVWILARFFHLPEEKKITLDRIGSEVWGLCDGKNTVKEIVKEFGERHSLDTRDAERSLTAYLGELSRRGMLGLKEEV